jgi:hypothetical protein
MAATVLVFLLVGFAFGTDMLDLSKVSPVPERSLSGAEEVIVFEAVDPQEESEQQIEMTRGNYNCYLRIYINEPVSRFRDSNGREYEFGFLAFAKNEPLSIPYLETYTDTMIWNAPYFVDTVSETNIAVSAAVFNQDEAHTTYSDPPYNDNTFTAYYVDGSAIATPGHPGTNSPGGGYTHTVFLEEATATW